MDGEGSFLRKMEFEKRIFRLIVIIIIKLFKNLTKEYFTMDSIFKTINTGCKLSYLKFESLNYLWVGIEIKKIVLLISKKFIAINYWKIKEKK